MKRQEQNSIRLTSNDQSSGGGYFYKGIQLLDDRRHQTVTPYLGINSFQDVFDRFMLLDQVESFLGSDPFDAAAIVASEQYA